MSVRKLSALDNFITAFDQGLRTLTASHRGGHGYAAYQSSALAGELTAAQRLEAARLMRVNHAGEVAAQALYRGHALMAQTAGTRAHMERAALEENDHLAWCEQRMAALGGRPSVLNPLWYGGSLLIGMLAGKAGDKWSLGFVAETERQVVAHLDKHLAQLPQADVASRALLEQMRRDEAAHATVAMQAGGMPLPGPVKKLMGALAGMMTGTAYWI